MGATSTTRPSFDAVLASQDFSQEQRTLLGLIDKLQFAQLDNVRLPQIVVVGDQSAGKSSVLWALTGIPFLRDAGACTRFATEIRLRRSNEEKFSIKIIPDKKRSYSDQERLSSFGNNIDSSMSFESIMKLAIHQIAPKGEPGRFVSEDRLVVEKSGPSMELLTVVDLPGLVQNPSNEQSADDVKAISDLNDRYMRSSRTIILAVIAGNQDFVLAPVLTKARKFDPEGRRTMGVLTKPDLTESIGLEDKFIALVSNRDQHNYYDLGWYVLLNPGPREKGQEWPSMEERKQAEDGFFAKSKWGNLPLEICGATALKQKLSAQLQRHIGRHINSLQKEIQRAYNDTVAELKLLGDGKDTVEEMREELIQRSSDSKELITPAVHGTYTNPLGQIFFPRNVDKKGTPPQKLRARVVEENRRFAEKLYKQGRSLNFVSSNSRNSTAMTPGHTNKGDFIRDEVNHLLKQNKGTEFPTDYNPKLIYTLFQNHSKNWAMLAQNHKDNLGRICNEFLGEVIDYVWPERMRESLRREYLDAQIIQILEKAQKEVDALQHDLQFEIEPYDPEYEDRLNKWREGRSYSVAEELLEKMLIYYELSAKIFIRNVITQVIERHLLEGLRNLFSWVGISRMRDATVIAIAAENQATREKRLNLKNQKLAIEEARDICANLAMRKELRSYERDSPEEDIEISDEEGPSSLGKDQRNILSQTSVPVPERIVNTTARLPIAPKLRPNKLQTMKTSPESESNYATGSETVNFSTSTKSNRDEGLVYSQSSPQGSKQYLINEFDPYSLDRSYVSYQAPPTPPRSSKILDDDEALARKLQAEEEAGVVQNESAPHESHKVNIPGNYPGQASPPDTNDHGRRKYSYPPLDSNGARANINNHHQPAPKPRKEIMWGLRN